MPYGGVLFTSIVCCRYTQDHGGPHGTLRTFPDSIDIEGENSEMASGEEGRYEEDRTGSMEVSGAEEEERSLIRGASRGRRQDGLGNQDEGVDGHNRQQGSGSEEEGGEMEQSGGGSSGDEEGSEEVYHIVADDIEGMQGMHPQLSELAPGEGEREEEGPGGAVRLDEQGGKVGDEMLVHGVAVWVPFQLDREVRMGGWKIVPKANASVIFDMDRNVSPFLSIPQPRAFHRLDRDDTK